MTTTPRTDVEEKEAAASRHHCGQDSHIEAGFARTLERELNEVREQLRTARADAFYEAAEIVMQAKWQKGSMNFNQGYIAGAIHLRAAEIRKETK